MKCLHKEGMFHVTRQFDGSIEPLRTSGWPMKLTDEVLEVINTAMQNDDETQSLTAAAAYMPYVTLHYSESVRNYLGFSQVCQNLHDVSEDMVHVDG